MELRKVKAERYVGPLREGGSLPLLVRGDDGGCYVVKMRGAGQGTLALVAEVVSGELLRRLELPVPEIVLVELHALFGRQEHDAEIRDLLRASTGVNAGLRFVDGATMFDPAAGDRVSEEMASRVVWGDAFVMNVDRTPRNANLLQRRDETWLIDHGASLYFQHDWATAEAKARSPFLAVKDHILLPWAGSLGEAGRWARERINEGVLRDVLELVPRDWLGEGEDAALRERYVQFLTERLAHAAVFEGTAEQEVTRARAGRL